MAEGGRFPNETDRHREKKTETDTQREGNREE